MRKGEVWLHNVHIAPRSRTEPISTLTGNVDFCCQKEIRYLFGKTQERGFAGASQLYFAIEHGEVELGLPVAEDL
jgi:tmRNA-binding protein